MKTRHDVRPTARLAALALLALAPAPAFAADAVQVMPDRQVRPGVPIPVFGAAVGAVGEAYTWSFAANPDVAVVDDGALAGAVGDDAFIAEAVSFQLLNGSTREVVRATLTVDDGLGGVAAAEVAIDVVAPADEISDEPLEHLAIEVNIAIEDGLRAMYLSQQADGRWRQHEHTVRRTQDCGTTAFSLWAFANRGYGPLSDGIYGPTARRAVQFILSDTSAFDPAAQAFIGDPDGDGNGRALNLCPGSVEGYAAPVAAAALIAAYAEAPLSVIDAGPYAGETAYQLVQDATDWIAFAQSDAGNVYRGGWRYQANQGSADTSVDSWNYLALEGFEAVFGGQVAEAVKLEAERRIVNTQAAAGWFGYFHSNHLIGTAHARTAGGISGLLMVSRGGRVTPLAGDVAARIDAAEGWLGANWDSGAGVWRGNLNNYYAMWTTARALRLAETPTLVNGGVTFDWETGEADGDGQVSPPGAREGYFPFLVRQQAATGHWAASVNTSHWTRNLNTAWAVLILTPTVFGPPNVGPECLAADVEVEVDEACAWAIDAADVDAGSSDPDGDPLNYSAAPDSGEGLDPTDVTLTVTDPTGLSDACVATVTPVDRAPPALSCEAGGPYECVAGCGADVALAAEATDNCPGDLPVADDAPGCFPVGTTAVTFTTADASGNGAECVAEVVVADTTPPVVVLGSPSNTIWPPNHACHEYDLIADCGLEVSDACAVDPADLSVAIDRITSDEPFEVGAGGDGHHAEDMEITGATTFKLRAERQGGGNGRVYSVHFTVTDPAGNATAGVCGFVVPHDQSPRHFVVDDGPAAECGADDDCVCAAAPLAQGRARKR